jgi:hypothetical protein
MIENSFSLAEWCAARRISRSMLYKLRAQGLAPRTHKAGDKLLVSAAADREWLTSREAEAAQVEAGA